MIIGSREEPAGQEKEGDTSDQMGPDVAGFGVQRPDALEAFRERRQWRTVAMSGKFDEN